ncbi:FAD-dependent oxidoreductase [Vreelandella alkaliphila]|uniref:Pyridine nucleotide-disulfide oxidoreductase n=1 Tax=Vreelandella alkaliphila TaxID=272774 RepID=A0ABX4HMX8_9GAMM|nr:FAD-dependent oxidoreductase [Halomonas humidisoli]PAU73733.1 pyridine nucleotide-disulfide oxidoreductase [Halomonas humidisoli]
MKDLVLIGAGHAHAFVLEAFAQHPDPSIAITVVSDSTLSAYSGSVPAWLAGECTLRETQIDVAALSQRAGAHLITSPAMAIAPTKRLLTLANGEAIHFDVASFNVGSTLRLPEQPFLDKHDEQSPYLLAMRPLSSLHYRWQALREKVDQLPRGSTQRVVSVGGGAAGCETLMSVLAQLRQQRSDITWQGALVSASTTLLPDVGWLPRWLTQRALRRAGVTVLHRVRGQALIAGGVQTSKGELIDADIVLWATGAIGQPWLQDTALPLNQRGFIQVNKTLEVAGQPGLFAAGDCAAFSTSLHSSPLPKAGVYAVRQGPVLAENLRAACHNESLVNWKPPKRVLALIGTGDSHAIASRGAIGFSGRWVWEWKKRIDARFIARFNPPFKH